jgi:hypothetical protein
MSPDPTQDTPEPSAAKRREILAKTEAAVREAGAPAGTPPREERKPWDVAAEDLMTLSWPLNDRTGLASVVRRACQEHAFAEHAQLQADWRILNEDAKRLLAERDELKRQLEVMRKNFEEAQAIIARDPLSFWNQLQEARASEDGLRAENRRLRDALQTLAARLIDPASRKIALDALAGAPQGAPDPAP